MRKLQLTLLAGLLSLVLMAQDNNPYEVFGHTSTVEYKTSQPKDVFLVENTQEDSYVKALRFDFKNGLITFLDKNHLAVSCIELDKNQMTRFTTMDPLAEKYYSTSPYAYCGNNPVNRIDPDGMDWYEDDDGNAMWRRTRDEEYTDENGKVWKNIGTEYLLFDGNNLHYLQQQDNEDGSISGLMAYSYGAVSGRKQEDGTFSYSEENQSQKNTGPIPDGIYSIVPKETQNYNDLNIVQKAASAVGKGSFPGGTYAWGENRVWINPSSKIVTDPETGKEVVRTNMSIHGGSVPGSAGCIDLHKNASPFFKRLSQSTSSSIRLNVLYTPYSKTSRIWRKK